MVATTVREIGSDEDKIVIISDDGSTLAIIFLDPQTNLHRKWLRTRIQRYATVAFTFSTTPKGKERIAEETYGIVNDSEETPVFYKMEDIFKFAEESRPKTTENNEYWLDDRKFPGIDGKEGVQKIIFDKFIREENFRGAMDTVKAVKDSEDKEKLRE